LRSDVQRRGAGQSFIGGLPGLRSRRRGGAQDAGVLARLGSLLHRMSSSVGRRGGANAAVPAVERGAGGRRRPGVEHGRRHAPVEAGRSDGRVPELRQARGNHLHR